MANKSTQGDFMIKIDATVKSETKYIAYIVILLSVIMQAAFLIIGAWDYKVLLGNILSGIAVILNFLFMGITVQKAVTKEKSAAQTAMRVSMLYRMLFLIVVVIIGVVSPAFNMWAVLITLFFPRIAVFIRPFVKREN